MSSTLVEVLVSAERLRDNTSDYQLYSFRRNWESYDCIVLIITAWVCYLQSWEGQTRSRKHRRVSLRKSHKVLLVSNPLFFFFSIFLSPKKKRGGTRKGIKFWIEKLIIKSAEELSFRGTWFHWWFLFKKVTMENVLFLYTLAILFLSKFCFTGV